MRKQNPWQIAFIVLQVVMLGLLGYLIRKPQENTREIRKIREKQVEVVKNIAVLEYQYEAIDKRLTRIENKLDRLIEMKRGVAKADTIK